MTDQELLVRELSSYARKLVTDYPISDALHDLIEATTVIFGIRGAGVSLASEGALSFAAASSEDLAALERIQEERQVGPCVEAFRSGAAVLVTDLTEDPGRWPDLTSAAVSSGIVAVAGIPMHLNGTRIGAVGLYATCRREWTAEEARTAELIAALAGGYLANASYLDQARQTVDQLQEALDSRVVIEQAKGVLAGERKISVDQAFEVLRTHARNRGASLREVANAVVRLGLRP